jgi:cytochrome bd-type quinol oxidase subunit 2
MAPRSVRRRFDPIAAVATPVVLVGLVLLVAAAEDELYLRPTVEALRQAHRSLHGMLIGAGVLAAAGLVLAARKHPWAAAAVAAPGLACVVARLIADSDNTLYPMFAIIVTTPFAIAAAIRATFPRVATGPVASSGYQAQAHR